MNHRIRPYRTLLSLVAAIAITLSLASCNSGNCTDKEALRKQITETEKAFEKMAADSGIANAFYYYAAENAVIKRGNDSLIHGRETIKNFYSKPSPGKRKVTWNPDFVDVSDDGTMAYTYGSYLWVITPDSGAVQEYRGVFNTIWQRQVDGKWKYVWD